MWMMGYNEPHDDHLNMSMVDSYTNNGTRKLRPLAPRPPPPTCATTSSSNRFHSTPHDHILHLNHHHHLVEQNKVVSREFNPQQMVVVSSRWNPTPEQLQTLEELYRRGTRTPSADEIQHITAQLRRFGKIEGKNVFYWFQNHKARERQKRRRQLDNNNNNKSSTTTNSNHDHIHHQPTTFFSTDMNHLDQLIQQKNLDVEETRNWAIPTFSEKNVLRERTGKSSDSMMTSIDQAAGNHQTWMIPTTTTVENQEEEEEEEDQRNDQNVLLLHHRRRKNFPATWNNIIQSSSSSSSSFPTNNYNHMITTSLYNSTATTTCCAPFPTCKTTSSLVVSSHAANRSHDHDDYSDESYETLELFPVNREQQHPEKCFLSNPRNNDHHHHHVSSLSAARQFIEFLPLKN